MINPSSRSRTAKQTGFTLIELLVVIAIIGILASLLLIAVMGGLRRAKLMQCGNNLRELGLATVAYTQRYGRYPDGAGPAVLEALRTKGRPPILEEADKLFVCPLTASTPGSGACDYRGPRDPLVDGRLKHSTPIACDKEGNHEADRSLNVLYPNGRVEPAPEDSPAYRLALDKTTP